MTALPYIDGTPELLAEARAALTARIPDPDVRNVLAEALGLNPYMGRESGRGRDYRGPRGGQDVWRTPDDLLGVITVPRAAGGRAVGS